MEKIYLPSGYFNLKHVITNGMTYNFIVGGRGIGKTFGCLRFAVDNGLKFIYMRRTQTQVDLIQAQEFNPFNALRSVLGNDYNFMMKKINKNITGVYQAEFDSGKQIYQPEGLPIGYILALSTVSNIRGFDASDVDILIYDEFIGEKHERPIKREATAFLNAVETIARNRELSGSAPLKVICLSNSNDLACPLFMGLKLVDVFEKMYAKGIEFMKMPEMDAGLYYLKNSPISKEKAGTSLYKLAAETEFKQMAVSNEFAEEQRTMIRTMPIKEFKPLAKIGEICIYEHKSMRYYYISGLKSGTPPEYKSDGMDLIRFQRDFYFLWLAYLNQNMYFESYTYKVLFEKYMKP